MVVQNRALISDDGSYIKNKIMCDERYVKNKMMMCQCLLVLIMHHVGTQTSHPGIWGFSGNSLWKCPALISALGGSCQMGAAEVRVEGTLHQPGTGGPVAIAENTQAGPPGSFFFLDL